MSDPFRLTMNTRPVVRPAENRPAAEPTPAPAAARPPDAFRAPPPAELRATLRQVDEALSGVIRDSDVGRVTDLLGRLSPGDYRGALQQMHRSGQLEDFIDNMEPAARGAFLAQAVARGYVRYEGGRPSPGGTGRPPAIPALIVNDPSLPASVREAIHDNNADAASYYERTYQQYVGRYTDAVEGAGTVPELRGLGSPVKRSELMEPGSNRLLLGSEWPHRALRTLADRTDDLLGRERVGSLSAHGGVSATLSDPGLPLEAGVGVSGRVVQGGRTEVDAGGTVGVTGTTRTGREIGVTVDGDGAELSVERGGTGGGIRADRNGGVAVTVMNQGVGGRVGVNATEATVELTGIVRREIGPVEIEAELGVGYRGMTRNQLHDALFRREGFFDIPSELTQGQPWTALSPERQRALNQIGWTPGEWAAAVRR